MNGSPTNPYASPDAIEAKADARPPAERLPLGRLLLGMLFVPLMAAAAHALLWPVGMAIEWGIDQLYGSAGVYLWVFDWATFVDNFGAVLVYAAINTFAFAGPVLLAFWWRRRLTPRLVLQAGGALAAVWWVGLSAVMVVMASGLFDPAVATTSGDPVLVQSAPVASAVKMVIAMGFFAPLPLLAGFAAWAWWVRQITQKREAPA